MGSGAEEGGEGDRALDHSQREGDQPLCPRGGADYTGLLWYASVRDMARPSFGLYSYSVPLGAVLCFVLLFIPWIGPLVAFSTASPSTFCDRSLLSLPYTASLPDSYSPPPLPPSFLLPLALRLFGFLRFLYFGRAGVGTDPVTVLAEVRKQKDMWGRTVR